MATRGLGREKTSDPECARRSGRAHGGRSGHIQRVGRRLCASFGPLYAPFGWEAWAAAWVGGVGTVALDGFC